jgi:predicted house-cleaning noncanonical NTP pyrophosphatase (MazG superfamily)
LRNYCIDNGFVYHPEAAMSDDYTSEEQRQLLNWLEEHLEQKSEEEVIDFFREYMNAEI